MKTLVRELLPHAPQMGLYLAPNIPAGKLRGALEDYAEVLRAGEVLALYDATLTGNARDGAVFAAERFVFQNNNLEAPQVVRYADVVRVEKRRRWLGLGGQQVRLEVNRGRATFHLAVDFSGKPEAAPYVARFLQEAMWHAPPEEQQQAGSTGTDAEAVRQTLERLRDEGTLTAADCERMLAVLHASPSGGDKGPDVP